MSDLQEGWYPLPGSSQERFWDGERWTAVRPQSGTPRPQSGTPRPQSGTPIQVVQVAATVPSGYPTTPAPAASLAAPNHGPAIASMVLGIVSLVIWWFGIVTGIVGLCLGATSLKHCEPRGPKRGRGFAITGIVCSIVALALWLIVLIAIGASA